METPISLLKRLRQATDQDAWPRFVELYTPLLFHWARQQQGGPDSEAADLVQELLLLLLRKLPEFNYDQHKSFRSWLRTVARNHWRNLNRRAVLPRAGDEALDQVAVADPAEAFWEADYRRHLVARALRLMQAEFQPTTWQACWGVIVEGKPAAQVATELGLSRLAVYVAKSRVLSRLRQELDGLID